MRLVLDYFKDVFKEVKNITFPGKSDVVLTSFSVFVIILITMTFIFITDCVISKVIKAFLGM
jgi:preprotein translocase SecE subunit